MFVKQTLTMWERKMKIQNWTTKSLCVSLYIILIVWHYLVALLFDVLIRQLGIGCPAFTFSI